MSAGSIKFMHNSKCDSWRKLYLYDLPPTPHSRSVGRSVHCATSRRRVVQLSDQVLIITPDHPASPILACAVNKLKEPVTHIKSATPAPTAPSPFLASRKPNPKVLETLGLHDQRLIASLRARRATVCHPSGPTKAG